MKKSPTSIKDLPATQFTPRKHMTYYSFRQTLKTEVHFPYFSIDADVLQFRAQLWPGLPTKIIRSVQTNSSILIQVVETKLTIGKFMADGSDISKPILRTHNFEFELMSKSKNYKLLELVEDEAHQKMIFNLKKEIEEEGFSNSLNLFSLVVVNEETNRFYYIILDYIILDYTF